LILTIEKIFIKMETQVVKKGVLNAFSGIITDLSVKEIENLQDCLSIQMHKLTDDGKRIKLKDLKKDLNIKPSQD
jgi:hypothetical protein